MTRSLAMRRLEAMWADVTAAVAKAIDEQDDPAALPNLVSVERVASAEFRPEGDPMPLTTTDSDHHGGQKFAAPLYVVLQHSLPLTLAELNGPVLAEVAGWAARARRVARDVVLSEMMRACTEVGNERVQVEGAVPLANRFHHLRLAAFTGAGCVDLRRVEWDSAPADASDADRTFRIERMELDRPVDGDPPGKVVGVLFEICGGPVVYRCSDLALSKKETDDHGVRLVLEEKFRIALGPEGSLIRIVQVDP